MAPAAKRPDRAPAASRKAPAASRKASAVPRVAPPVTRKPAAPSSKIPPPTPVAVRLPINLGQFLKAAMLVSSGGEAKLLIAQGAVRVNGQPELRRGHKLSIGDVVQVAGAAARVTEASPECSSAG